MKKVLIAAPIGSKKEYSINIWFQWIANQDYENFDYCLCANGKDRIKLHSMIKEVEIKTWQGAVKRPIALMLPNSGDLSVIQKITYSRERIRRYALENHYDAVFWLDTDTIPANRYAIQKLLNWNKDSVSGLYFYKDSQVPVCLDPITHTNYSMGLLETAAGSNTLLPVQGTGYGCLLHQGKALRTPFDYDLFGEERTDDFGHCAALEAAGINRWLDPSILCKHFSPNNKFIHINEMVGLTGPDKGVYKNN